MSSTFSRHIEELQVGSIVRQFFRPCLLETDVADAEIGLALGKRRQAAGAWGRRFPDLNLWAPC